MPSVVACGAAMLANDGVGIELASCTVTGHANGSQVARAVIPSVTVDVVSLKP